MAGVSAAAPTANDAAASAIAVLLNMTDLLCRNGLRQGFEGREGNDAAAIQQPERGPPYLFPD